MSYFEVILMNSMEISNYLEKIRHGRKMTQENFIDGVCSMRQYQRYRSGDSEIPYEKIELFAKKLGIPAQKIFNEYKKEKDIQGKLVSNFYNAVATQDKDQIKALDKKLESDILIDKEHKLQYRFAKTRNELLTKHISKADYIHRISNLINYPQVLKQSYYTDVEVMVLNSLLETLEGKELKRLLKKLDELFETQTSILSSGGDFIYSVLIMGLAKNYGKYKQFDRVIYYCDLGIEKGKIFKQYYLFDYFYYYKALAYRALGDIEACEASLFKCYNVLHMEDNPQKTKQFTTWIEKDFDIVFHTFIMKYLKKSIS